MYIDEYGKENKQIIVMLHGANFVHTFGKQYVLSDRYHIIVPHLMGFGNETSKTFHADQQIAELTTYIESLGQKAAHNILPVYAGKLNAMTMKLMEETDGR